MKVYVVQSVGNKDGDDVLGYIYPYKSNMAVFKSYECAIEFVKKRVVNYQGIKYENIVFRKNDKDSRVTYVIELPNEFTDFNILLACIVERELQD